MNGRIKEIRLAHELTQEQFADKLGLSRNFITQLENGTKQPSERTLSDICRIFSINSEWLRSGKGEMKIELTKNQEIAQFLNDVMAEDDEDFRKNFVEVLASLNEKEWEALASTARKLVDELIKKG